MPKPASLPMMGKVTARSPYGIKLDDMEEWINFSKPEYRDEPWEWEDVQKGDWVQITRSGNFFKSICLVEPPAGEPMVRGPEEGYRAELGEGAPFEGVETTRNPIITDREQSIQNQVALKCAVELVIGMAGPRDQGALALPAADQVVQVYRKFAAALNE